jgi:hypothetical protein
MKDLRNEPLVPVLADVASVKLVGLGGVGGIVARYLTAFLAASPEPTQLILIDGDEFEERNAERMLFSRCGNKAEVVCDELLPFVGDASKLTLAAVPEYLVPENLPRLLCDDDVILLAVDNHATRKLVGEHCRTRLFDSCLISGGNDGVGEDGSGRFQRGSYGNVQIHRRRDSLDLSPPLGAYHPEIEAPADRLPTDESCSEAILSVPQILFTNLATASAILNAFFLYACDRLDYPELCFDIADGRMQPLPLPWPLATPAS